MKPHSSVLWEDEKQTPSPSWGEESARAPATCREPAMAGTHCFRQCILKKDSDLSSDDRVLKTQTHVQKEAELV